MKNINTLFIFIAFSCMSVTHANKRPIDSISIEWPESAEACDVIENGTGLHRAYQKALESGKDEFAIQARALEPGEIVKLNLHDDIVPYAIHTVHVDSYYDETKSIWIDYTTYQKQAPLHQSEIIAKGDVKEIYGFEMYERVDDPSEISYSFSVDNCSDSRRRNGECRNNYNTACVGFYIDIDGPPPPTDF